jgi:hypothetical protein
MRQRLVIRAVVVCLAAGLWLGGAGASNRAHAENVWTFYTGAAYMKAPDLARTLYVAGLSDSFNALAAAGDIRAPWIVACTLGKHSSELTAMFDRWLQANPSQLDRSAPRLFLIALRANCGQ